MILIGQYDSPFVRRVGIALRLYDLPFEHRPWSAFGDADQLGAINPLCRVPTLMVDDGLVLTDSHMILDYLDSLVAEPMTPRDQPARARALQVAALACGLAEKAVSLFYERRLHEVTSPVWVARCEGQIKAVLAALEADRSARAGPFWFGSAIGHADIAVSCALRFLREAHPWLYDPSSLPSLARHAAMIEAMPVFQDIAQPFIPPA